MCTNILIKHTSSKLLNGLCGSKWVQKTSFDFDACFFTYFYTLETTFLSLLLLYWYKSIIYYRVYKNSVSTAPNKQNPVNLL